MPYIKQEHRKLYKNVVSDFGHAVTKFLDSGVDPDTNEALGVYETLASIVAFEIENSMMIDPKLRPGHMNYLITSIIHRLYGSKMRYFDYNQVAGVFEVVLHLGEETAELSNTKEEHLQQIINQLMVAVYDNAANKDMIEALGMLRCCATEFYRRSTSIYEDQCIELNGDVKPDLEIPEK